MKKLNLLILILFIGVSCQHNSGMHSESKASRSLANNSVMRIFLQEVANKTKSMTAKSLEEEAIKFIKYHNSTTNIGNWEQIGITREQALRIRSLYDDLPYMNKVRKWVRSNITKVYQVQASVAEQAFEVIMRGKTGYINPYTFHAQGATGLALARRKSLSPFLSVNEHQKRVALTIERLTKDFDKLSKSSARSLKSLQTMYKESMVVMIRRGKKSPSLLANGNEIVESACKITQKTGRPGMGAGCKKFNETAAESIISNKADIDQLRAQIIEERAYSKAGKYFESFNDIAPEMRLTQVEIDEATIEAFKRVNAMTDDEARVALQRLKQNPCKIY